MDVCKRLLCVDPGAPAMAWRACVMLAATGIAPRAGVAVGDESVWKES
jgi:hypothetical protein